MVPDDRPSVVEVLLQPATVAPGIRQPTELAGLYTALLESGLSDLYGVAGMVEGVRPSPGLAGRLETGAERWTGMLSIEAEGDSMRYELLLCDPENLCSDLAANATRDGIAEAVAQLLGYCSEALGRAPVADAAASWALPQSTDPYAVLIAGRSAAVFYGVRPPTPADLRGDNRRDPVARAVFIDPSMPIAWWIAGREQMQNDEPKRARESFTRAAVARPTSAVLQADEAALLAVNGRYEASWLAWQELEARAPGDPRFTVTRARVALAAGKVKESLALIEAMPPRFQKERSVAELRVAIAEATGESSNYDQLLERWQVAAPNEPEPVRRRIALRVDDGRLAEALALTSELDARGAAEEAARLGMGLGVGLGDYEEAAKRAEQLGLTDAAGRIRARAALERDPAVVPSEIADGTDAIALVLAGEALLRAGRADEALIRARRALAQDAWMPEALDLQARVLEQLGRLDEAQAARARLEASDPGWGS